MCDSTARVGSSYKELKEQAAEFRFDMLKNENPSSMIYVTFFKDQNDSCTEKSRKDQ